MVLFVLSSPAVPAAVVWLCSSLRGLCEQAEGSCGDAELAGDAELTKDVELVRHILSGKTHNRALVQQGL